MSTRMDVVQDVNQGFGNAEASIGSLLFQGHVSGPLHIHRKPTSMIALDNS